VTYRVRFEAYALVQLHGLPSEAFDALLDRVVELVDEPWDAVVMPPGNDPAYRHTVSPCSAPAGTLLVNEVVHREDDRLRRLHARLLDDWHQLFPERLKLLR
jgi:hypothetical protein